MLEALSDAGHCDDGTGAGVRGLRCRVRTGPWRPAVLRRRGTAGGTRRASRTWGSSSRVQAVPLEKEIILVDDGSTDGTWDVVQAFADVPNITLVRRARNQGKGVALRDGFARATTDIVIRPGRGPRVQPE